MLLWKIRSGVTLGLKTLTIQRYDMESIPVKLEPDLEAPHKRNLSDIAGIARGRHAVVVRNFTPNSLDS